MYWKKISCAFVIALTSWMGLGTPATAHPHVWIDMRTAILFDDAGMVEGLQVHWRFDELYSLFLTEEMADTNGEISADKLKSLARQNIENLKEFSYFTYARVAGSQTPYGEVTEYESKIEDSRISLDFVIPFEKPIDPLLQAFSYAVYDPSYYISFLYMKNSPVILDAEARPECRYAIQGPNPNPDAVSLANSLDKTETAGNGLGVLFSEKVTLICE